MSDEIRRGRDRPPGTGKPDQPTLRKIAELLLDEPMLKPTTAIKRLIGTKNDSDIRRLQVKWKAEGAIFTAQANERRERRPKSAPTSRWRGPLAVQLSLEKLGPSATILDSPSIRAAVEAQARIAELFKPSPELRALLDLLRPSPAIQAVIDAMKPSHELQAVMNSMRLSPAMQTAIDTMRPSPAMQAAMKGAARLTRQFAGSPALDALGL